ncbi:MAG: glycosyltransferase family 2 protein [Pirellulales bacterium]|nr:glycosyltransferase family 2 protein [Pirellulales bacterium]
MARLACIIPVLGTTDGLETTLVSVLERRPDDCELIVVLNVPYDDPYQLSGEVKLLAAPRRAGLVQCLNLGIGATRAPIIHTLASGYEVSDGWIDRAYAHFDDPRVAAVAPAIHSAADRQQRIAAGVGYTRGGSKTITAGAESLSGPADDMERQPASGFASHRTAVGPWLTAAFIRRAALDAFGGGLPTAVGDELADLDLALTLRRAGWRMRFDSQCQVFAQRIDAPKHSGLTAALHAERLFWRHWSETSRVASLLIHPLTAIRSIIGSGVNAPLAALGRFVGLCQFGSTCAYRQTLAAATAAAEQAAAEWQWQADEAKQKPSAARGQSLRIDQPHPASRRAQPESNRAAKPATAANRRG